MIGGLLFIWEKLKHVFCVESLMITTTTLFLTLACRLNQFVQTTMISKYN